MPTLSRRSNLELLNMPDCGGLQENGRCRWLNVSLCIGTACSYCGAKSSLQKAYERLRSLDEKAQDHIAQKHYGGRRPWIETN